MVEFSGWGIKPANVELLLCQNALPQPRVAQSRGPSESQLPMAVCEGPDTSKVPEELVLAVVPSPTRIVNRFSSFVRDIVNDVLRPFYSFAVVHL
ncbi:hypothetical protein DUI87_11359 [Hirundo rustica rustica]|uniref:Uncharacterized protein n=1 Tax=Hirundo rustica rustica TaxID=333673 RepID=A0A3M0KDJ0_HIRRU|nr:hypothetical protein DUI87_11359 [Hirundo rustica rustica]